VRGQGYNRMIVFSRSSYFCLCACLILALHYGGLTWSRTVFSLYGVPFTVYGSLVFARDFIIGTLFNLCTFARRMLDSIRAQKACFISGYWRQIKLIH